MLDLIINANTWGAKKDNDDCVVGSAWLWDADLFVTDLFCKWRISGADRG